MKKVVHKLLFIWDYDKKKWLGKITTKGLRLVTVLAFACKFENILSGDGRGTRGIYL